MVLERYTYIFVIGTFFALLDAYNNGASEWCWPGWEEKLAWLGRKWRATC